MRTFVADSKQHKYAKLTEALPIAFQPKASKNYIYAGTVFEYDGETYVAKELLWCKRDRTQVIIAAEVTRERR